MLRRPLAALLGAGLLMGAASAQEDERAVWSALFENDVFVGTDRNYTAGTRFSRADRATGWQERLGQRLLPGTQETVIYDLAVGISIFTPRDIVIEEPLFDQHPYAGWLHGEWSLAGRSASGASNRLTLQLGVIGPASLAEEAQNLAHQLVSGDEAEGWEYQVGNEPGAVLSFEHGFPPIRLAEMGRATIDLTPSAGAAIGNVYTHANAGAVLRAGFDLPRGLPVPRVKPALTSTAWWAEGDAPGTYLYAGVEARAVAYNATLEGRLFSDDPVTVDAKTGVYDLQAGLAIGIGENQLHVGWVRRSEEFDAQVQPHDFGTIAISRRF